MTGSLDTELSTFMIEFLDTQMVQSFRDLLTGSNRKLNEHEDTNEDLMMTKWKKYNKLSNFKWYFIFYTYLTNFLVQLIKF